MEFINENIWKIIIGLVIAIITGIIYKFIEKKKESDKNKNSIIDTSNSGSLILGSNNTSSIVYGNVNNIIPSIDINIDKSDLETRKKITKILFIDDDSKFKVVNILKKSGWVNTTLIKDVSNLDDVKIREADIFFVDIQGVGLALECKDEGLGLSLNLIKKYPDKKLVIYSAETKGDRFHEALKKANSFLAKNAEPYEFQELVEQFSKEIYPNV